MAWIVMGRRYASVAQMTERIAALDRQYGGKRFGTEARAEWNALNAEVDEAERETRRARLLELARNPENCESGDGSAGTASRATTPGTEARDRALGVVDRFTRAGTLTAAAADRLDAHVRRGDPLGLDARYLDAVGDPHYASAFAKLMSDPVNGHLRFEPREVEAVRNVTRAEAQRAAMVGGTGSAGGFALPVEVDPTVLLSSDGAINPVRALAGVRTISTREWVGVSSDGVAASYDAELEEVSDDSPTFAQPRIVTAQGRAWIQASIELFDDWGALVTEMTKLFSDARDVLDAQAFLDGTGTDEPEGVLTGLGVGQKYETAGSNAVTLADLYGFKQSVPDRFKGASVFAFHSDSVDFAWQMVSVADQSEARAMEGRSGDLLGRPVVEWNNLPGMAGAPGDNVKVGIVGDWKAGFVIADRIGSTVELVPHVMGPNRLPIGARGLFFRWRTGSTVVNPAALRYLAVKP